MLTKAGSTAHVVDTKRWDLAMTPSDGGVAVLAGVKSTAGSSKLQATTERSERGQLQQAGLGSTYEVYVHYALRSAAKCGCGWRGKRRLLVDVAIVDAEEHAERTGHVPATPLVLRRLK